MAMPKIKIYTTPYCPYCHSAKEYFEEKGVEYEEIDVMADPKGGEELFKISGQYGVPVILIDGKVIIGFDKSAIDEALGF